MWFFSKLVWGESGMAGNFGIKLRFCVTCAQSYIMVVVAAHLKSWNHFLKTWAQVDQGQNLIQEQQLNSSCLLGMDLDSWFEVPIFDIFVVVWVPWKQWPNSLWPQWAAEEKPHWEIAERQMWETELCSSPPEPVSLLCISLIQRQIKIQGLVPHSLHNACVQIFACSSGSKEPGDSILTVVLSQAIAVLCLCE